MTGVRWLTVALLLAGSVARAEAAETLQPQHQAVLLARALAYDHNLGRGAGEGLVVVILGRRGNAASDRAMAQAADAFQQLAGVKVKGLPISPATLVASAAELEREITLLHANVVYVCPGWDGELAAIKTMTRKRKILSIGSSPTLVEQGLSLGAFMLEGKVQIMVNLPASKEEGADFASTLLGLAKVLR